MSSRVFTTVLVVAFVIGLGLLGCRFNAVSTYDAAIEAVAPEAANANASPSPEP